MTASASVNLEFITYKTNHLTMETCEDGGYVFTTQGNDPYIYARIDGLQMLQESDTHLTFEYKSQTGVPGFMCYFVDEEGTHKSAWSFPALAPAEDWTLYSVDISEHILKHNWGNMLDWIRLDFGSNADKDVAIRNIHICAPGEEWAETVRDEEADLANVLALGLPVLIIETMDRVEPTSEAISHPEGCIGTGLTNAAKVPGYVKILFPDGSVAFDSGEYVKGTSGMTVKHRGNTSALAVFKPLKIKLEKKGDMLLRGDKKYNDKNWVLLNDPDAKLYIGMKLNQLMNHQWAPSSTYVNVIMNGRYNGLMLLAEAYERNTDCRISTSKTGFIAELDLYWWNEDGAYLLSKQNPIVNYTFKYPDFEDMTDEQKTYIQGVLTAYEESVTDGTFDQIIDVNSFARWLLGHDILGTKDHAGSNRYYVKEDNTEETLLGMGCMWDFDSIEDNIGEFAEIHKRFPFNEMFVSDNQSFLRAYISLWDEMKETVFADMQSFLTGLMESDDINAHDSSFYLDSKVSAVTLRRTLTKNAQRSLEWYQERRAELEPRIEELRTRLDGETGVSLVGGGSGSNCDNTVYDLMGRRVNNPTPGVYVKNGRKFVVK